MVKNLQKLADGMTNVDWLNAIRNDATDEYRARIPEATQANIQEVINSLMTWGPGRNQAIDALINKIGLTIFVQQSWTNPLAQFKRGFLNYGETIEEIMNGLVPASTLDPDRDSLEKDVWGKVKPEVQVNYHSVNRRDKYKVTIQDRFLHNAFTSPTGLQTEITALMNSLQTSDQNDEYLIMARLFSEFDRAAGDQGIYNVHVDDIGDQGSDGPASRFMLRQLRKFSNVLPFISRYYNPAGMPVAANPDDLILFVTADADAAMDVEALAAAFNITKAEFGSRKIVLPTPDFGIKGVQGILTTKDFFVAADQRIEFASIHNPDGLYNNHWLHHWGVYSASRFAPLIMFNSERPSTTITVVETPVVSIGTVTITDDQGATQATNVIRGELYNVDVVAVTNPVGGSNDAVRYDITGATSQFTRITNTGTLYVGPDETADTLTIVITSIDNEAVKTSVTRSVVGTLLRLWPDPVVKTDVDSDTLEEPVLGPNTLTKASGKVKIPDPTDGYTLTRTIKEGVAFTDNGDLVTVPEHGAEVNDTVVFGTITGTTGITAGTTYYVKQVVDKNTFTIAATAGGAVLPLTTNGTAASAQFVAKDGKSYVVGGLTDYVATAEAGHELAAGSQTLWTFDN